MEKPLILEIKGNSLDDGPGIRSVIFFKGCPLSCVWCHNPESKRRDVEIAFDGGQCVACNQCLEICPKGALARDQSDFIDRTRCDLCFACTAECPSGALSRVGGPMTVDDIVAAVLKDRVFFDNSGGGVTLSGGEPTLNMGFTKVLLKRLKEQGLHTLVETCGLFDLETFEKNLYPSIDTIYFDIKLMDDGDHRHYCGAPNAIILKNFQSLNQQYRDGGVEILPRTPLIPGITDTGDNLRAIIEFFKTCGVKKAALLEYHPLWREKNRKLGIDEPAAGPGDLESFSSRGHLQECRQLFLDAGIEVG